jgi:hypothetical protein
MKWLVNEASFGLFTFTDLTRFIAAIIDVPYRLASACSLPAFSPARARPPCRSCRRSPGSR